MKILMATMGLDIGGAETHIVELAKELRHQGHDVAVVSNGGVYVPEITAAGIRHYAAPMHRRSLRDMRRARTILRDVIARERPDVVHAHARIPAFLCGCLQKQLHFPFVTTAHWVFDARGALRYLTNWGQRTIAVSEDIKAYLIREYAKREQTKITNQEKQNDMASLTKAINKDLFDSILPTFGNQRVHIDVYKRQPSAL